MHSPHPKNEDWHRWKKLNTLRNQLQEQQIPHHRSRKNRATGFGMTPHRYAGERARPEATCCAYRAAAGGSELFTV
jgi:hypothetical protein